MDIHTASKYMVHGYRIRREGWRGKWLSKYVLLDEYCQLENLLADDWQIITEGIVNHFPVEY